jgi:predicted alpha/beta-hydrolase family hydrolase
VPTPDDQEEIETTAGLARVNFFRVPNGVPRALVVLGHGAGSGIASWDLQYLARELPPSGIDVALFEQPWVVAGKKVAPAQSRVDAAFREGVTALKRSGEALRRLIVGGRSSGARIACRTAAEIDADGVLCLAFPLHPPGKSTPNRVDELAAAARQMPVTVLQGARDPFGSATELAGALQQEDSSALTIAVPWADHGLQVKKKAPVTQEEVGLLLAATASLAAVGRGRAVGSYSA